MKKFFIRICALAAVVLCLYGGAHADSSSPAGGMPAQLGELLGVIQSAGQEKPAESPSDSAEFPSVENPVESSAQEQAPSPVAAPTDENGAKSAVSASSPADAASDQSSRYFAFDEELQPINQNKDAPGVDGFRDLKFGMTANQARATDAIKNGVPLFGEIRDVDGSLRNNIVSGIKIDMGAYKLSDFDWQLLDDVLSAINGKYPLVRTYTEKSDGGKLTLGVIDPDKEEFYAIIDGFSDFHDFYESEIDEIIQKWKPRAIRNFGGPNFVMGDRASSIADGIASHLVEFQPMNDILYENQFGKELELLVWAFENGQIEVILDLSVNGLFLLKQVQADSFPDIKTTGEMVDAIADMAREFEPRISLSISYNERESSEWYLSHLTKIAQERARAARQEQYARQKEQERQKRVEEELQSETTSDDF